MIEKNTSARAVSLPGLRDGWYLTIGLALIAVGIVLMGRKIYLDSTWPAGTDISVYLSALKNIAAGLHPYGDVHAHPFAYPPLFSELLTLLFPFSPTENGGRCGQHSRSFSSSQPSSS